jgi:hypothetical protein
VLQSASPPLDLLEWTAFSPFASHSLDRSADDPLFHHDFVFTGNPPWILLNVHSGRQEQFLLRGQRGAQGKKAEGEQTDGKGWGCNESQGMAERSWVFLCCPDLSALTVQRRIRFSVCGGYRECNESFPLLDNSPAPAPKGPRAATKVIGMLNGAECSSVVRNGQP